MHEFAASRPESVQVVKTTIDFTSPFDVALNLIGGTLRDRES
jgi:hypothetical protein